MKFSSMKSDKRKYVRSISGGENYKKKESCCSSSAIVTTIFIASVDLQSEICAKNFPSAIFGLIVSQNI